jgi:hypothetical protein
MSNLNTGLNVNIRNQFPDLIPIPRPFIPLPTLISPEWLSGFTTGDGSFNIIISQNRQEAKALGAASCSKTFRLGFQVTPVFQLSQHSRDLALFNFLQSTFKCGTIRWTPASYGR